MNPIAGWLVLIGTAANARKLRMLIEKLPAAVVDGDGRIVEPAMCPTIPRFGMRESARLYADPTFRPALDAWDTGLITKQDIVRLCHVIEGRERSQRRTA